MEWMEVFETKLGGDRRKGAGERDGIAKAQFSKLPRSLQLTRKGRGSTVVHGSGTARTTKLGMFDDAAARDCYVTAVRFSFVEEQKAQNSQNTAVGVLEWVHFASYKGIDVRLSVVKSRSSFPTLTLTLTLSLLPKQVDPLWIIQCIITWSSRRGSWQGSCI